MNESESNKQIEQQQDENDSIEVSEEKLTCKELIKLLNDSSVDCCENNDYLTFTTILEIYLNKNYLHKNFDQFEIVEILNNLYQILELNKILLFNISWDLPNYLIDLIDLNWQYNEYGIKNSKNLMIILKIFNLLCINSNEKECILTSCELLSKLIKNSDFDKKFLVKNSKNKMDVLCFAEIPSRNYIIKFHSLLQLINSCYRKLNTNSPSKFLSIIISSFINFISLNYDQSDLLPVVRRLYTFIRDYQPFPNITDPDEEFLQGKLLIYFTYYLLNCESSGAHGLLTNLYLSNLNKKMKIRENEKIILTNGQLNQNDLLLKLISLLESFDIDISEEFNKELKLSSDIFYEIDNNYNKNNNQKDDKKDLNNEAIFNISINFYNLNKKLSNKKLFHNLNGIILSYTFTLLDNGSSVSLKTSDLIKLSLRVMVPFIIEPKLVNYGSVISLIILLFDSLNDKESAVQDLQTVNPHLITTCIQCFISLLNQLHETKPYIYEPLVKLDDELYKPLFSEDNDENDNDNDNELDDDEFFQDFIANNKDESKKEVIETIIAFYERKEVISKRYYNKLNSINKLFYSFLMKFLIRLPQDISWNFIIDTLSTCPFINSQISIIQILKELIIRNIDDDDDDDKQQKETVNESMDKLSLNNNNKIAPKLPPRNYIELTDERLSNILTLFDDCSTEFLKDFNNLENLNKLLTFINLLISINLKLNIENKNSILPKINELESKIKSLKESKKDENDQSTNNENNNENNNNLNLILFNIETLYKKYST
ncbi:hypothetical protein B5S33_g4684 [[Candida] boidinii]|nr:hypothetical protein B5S33_g4684 [[Candida] boidinii]